MQHHLPLVRFVLVSLIVLGLILIPRQNSTSPKGLDNICQLLQGRPQWYRAARMARKRWGISISIQMAIIYAESRFRDSARPARSRLFGILPLGRPSSAEGYAQAIDATWSTYQRATHQPFASRRDFTKAVDFIGWYLNRVHALLAISKQDPFHLYLAYHEGVGGYRSGTYRGHFRTLRVATSVAKRAQLYREELLRCEGRLLFQYSRNGKARLS